MAIKWGCHFAYKYENSDNGNQIVTSECGVSFKQKSPEINFIMQFVPGWETLGTREQDCTMLQFCGAELHKKVAF